MAEIKKQRPRRKFGLGDLFVILLLVIVIVGVVIGVTQNTNKVEHLNYGELVAKMQEGLIENIQAQGVKGEGNNNLATVIGDFVKDYQDAKTYTSTMTWDQYNQITDDILNAQDTF